MVTTLLPATAAAVVTQERIGWPSTWTVQAPHTATPQPYLVPVNPSCSRRTHKSGTSGPTSTCCVLPLTTSEIMAASRIGDDRQSVYAQDRCPATDSNHDPRLRALRPSSSARTTRGRRASAPAVDRAHARTRSSSPVVNGGRGGPSRDRLLQPAVLDLPFAGFLDAALWLPLLR